jgi:hypothetical protein
MRNPSSHRKLALLAGACASIALWACTPQTVIHQSTPAANAPARGITVSGFGKASGKPNIARSTVGVEARAGTAEEAIAQVNALMSQVIGAVKQAGVAERDIRTETISLHFERAYEPPPRPVEMAPAAPAPAAPAPATPGKTKAAAPRAEAAPAPAPKLPQGFYTATNNVELTIRHLDRAGQVLSAATSAGANSLYGIRFELEDPAPLLASAREKAVADARQRAERLAQLAGVKLGPIVAISESDGGMPVPMLGSMMMKREAAQEAPVERGEVTVTSSVQIVYEVP